MPAFVSLVLLALLLPLSVIAATGSHSRSHANTGTRKALLARSSTYTLSRTGSLSRTSTRPQVVRTASRAPSRSSSQTRTPSETQTVSPCPSRTTLFDGTHQQHLPVITSQSSQLNSSMLSGVSFVFSQFDASCGPGLWSLNELVLPLSRPSNGSARALLKIQYFITNVGIVHVVLTWPRLYPTAPSPADNHHRIAATFIVPHTVYRHIYPFYRKLRQGAADRR